MTLSVVMVTENEEGRIRDALESVKGADEIIVVDALSRDRTVEIAREYTPKVFSEEWKGFSAQKDSAIQKAEGEWILLLDADERVTPELWDEITGVVMGKSGVAGYEIPRKSFFLGRWISHGGWWPDYTLRLFRRGTGRVSPRRVHERIVVDGPVGRLKSPLLHLTCQSISQFIGKADRYAGLSAREMAERGGRFSLARLFFSPPATFIRMYIIQRGFLDGAHGFVLAGLYSYYTFLKYARLWEERCISE